MSVQIGECYMVQPAFCGKQEDSTKAIKGRVIEIHMKGRFAILEFEGYWGKVRECFPLEDLKPEMKVLERRRHHGKR